MAATIVLQLYTEVASCQNKGMESYYATEYINLQINWSQL